MQISSPSWAEIDLSALVYNLTQIKNLLPPDVQIMGVVKANAYGHGAVQVSRTLLKNGASCLGVAFVKEAAQLREAGINAPIVLLSGVMENAELPLVVKLDLQPFIYNREIAQLLSDTAIQMKQRVKVHIKVDTGMGRMGVFPAEFLDFVRFISQLGGLEIAGLSSHLACADDDENATLQQLELFQKLLSQIKQAGFNIPVVHLANSAAVISYPATYFNLVRPGLMLYGLYPHPGLREKINLKPALSFKSKIVSLKRFPAGSPLSYGYSYINKAESLIAAVSVGYADGYNRLLSNRGEVLVCGQRALIRGRICMDMTLVDVTHIPGVRLGDEVTLIGKDGEQEITASDVAAWMGTIPYEVTCLISQRVERVYIKGIGGFAKA